MDAHRQVGLVERRGCGQGPAVLGQQKVTLSPSGPRLGGEEYLCALGELLAVGGSRPKSWGWVLALIWNCIGAC